MVNHCESINKRACQNTCVYKYIRRLVKPELNYQITQKVFRIQGKCEWAREDRTDAQMIKWACRVVHDYVVK